MLARAKWFLSCGAELSLERVATVTFPGTTLCSATVAYRVLVCSLQLCMHVVAVTAVPVGLLVTQCQLLHRLCMPNGGCLQSA